MNIDTKENLQAAGICLFSGFLMMVSGAYIVGLVALLCGLAVLVVPPVFRWLGAGTEDGMEPATSRWWRSLIILPLVLASAYGVYVVANMGSEYYQCYDAGGNYTVADGSCR